MMMCLAEAAGTLVIGLTVSTGAVSSPVSLARLVRLSSTLTPPVSAQPPLPKVDVNACPFEGCQFGRWIARENVPAFSTWQRRRRSLGTIRRGEIVIALTGVHITLAPSRIRVTADIPAYGLKPGNMIYGYMNVGEGAFNAWFNGHWVDEFEGARIKTQDGMGCRRDCNARMLAPCRSQWWVQVRTGRGVGWVRDAGRKFDGTDALSGR